LSFTTQFFLHLNLDVCFTAFQ